MEWTGVPVAALEDSHGACFAVTPAQTRGPQGQRFEGFGIAMHSIEGFRISLDKIAIGEMDASDTGNELSTKGTKINDVAEEWFRPAMRQERGSRSIRRSWLGVRF